MTRIFESRQEQDRDSQTHALPQQLHAGFTGEDLIEQDEIGAPAAELQAGFENIPGGARDLQAVDPVDQVLEQLPHGFHVFDNEKLAGILHARGPSFRAA